MSCFSCFVYRWKKEVSGVQVNNAFATAGNAGINTSEGGRKKLECSEGKVKIVSSGESSTMAASFSFEELSMATEFFKELIGEGGFGRVYKGCLPTGEHVAVKQLNPDGYQGCQEFLTEVFMLSVLRHSHLVKLIGYCNNRDEKLLVYEYMPKGCLQDHLFDVSRDREPLSWSSRMKIAVGAARGLKYLHCTADPPVIYRDMKSANILLENDFSAKLSDFGIAKLGPVGDNTHVSTRVMGTEGYCAPEYFLSGKLTKQSDIYSFGVVLLELVTGRRALDHIKNAGERDLISWSRPYINDPRKFMQMADPLLQGHFPKRGMHQLISMTAMCLREDPIDRPTIGHIVDALEYLASQSTSKVRKDDVRSRNNISYQEENNLHRY